MPLENFFDINGQLDVRFLNERANELWKRKKGDALNSTRFRSTFSKDNYELTSKQVAFINEGQLFFKQLYIDIYTGYQDRSAFKLSEAFQKVMDGYFKNKKYNTMLGQPSAAETGGMFRGLVAFLIFRKDQDSKEKAEAEAKFLKEMEPMVTFFADYKNAKIIFVEFLLHIAIRFQNAIELLDNHEEGVMNFVRFIVTFCLLDIKKYLNNQGSSLEGKVLFLINSLLERPEALSETIKEWQHPHLKTMGSMAKTWTIVGLLHKSSIETPKGMFFYSGKDEIKEAFYYPAQIVSDGEDRKLALYSPVIN